MACKSRAQKQNKHKILVAILVMAHLGVEPGLSACREIIATSMADATGSCALYIWMFEVRQVPSL